MPTVGKIKVDLEGDTRRFNTAMNSAARRTMALRRQLTTLRGVILPLTGAFGFGSLIRSTFQNTERMAQLSRRLSTSVEGFSRLARVLNRAGIGMDQTATMLQRLQRRTADARDGNRQLQEAFSRLGLNVDRFIRLNPVEAFVQLTEALDKVTSPAERIALAFRLLDSEGVQVLQQNIPALRSEMQQTTAVTTKQAENVEKLREAWTKLGETLESGVAGAFVKLTEPPPPASPAQLSESIRRALDPFAALRGRLMDWIRGALGLEDSAITMGAPRTGRIRGRGVPNRIQVGPLPSQPPVGTFQGGTLGNTGGSDLILEQLRAIRRNTETGGARLQ